ncbi:MAG: GatB/YqeY domain-containing protein [Microgenomates group bacterium]
MKEKLKQDSITALKEHNQPLVDVLRFLISLIDKRELQLPLGAMTEAEEMAVMRKELKNKEESREMFLKGNRMDLVEQLDFEIKTLKSYLPSDMTQEELDKIVDEAIVEAGNNFGGVMKIVVAKVAGRVGGEKIAPIVKKKLETSN